MVDRQQIRGLITRLARIDAGEGWADDLNPAQRAALDYLGQANRFSRSPSHVAEYLGTTRGTKSQTLKVLVRKGYVTELRSEADKRTISYALTQAGRNAMLGSGLLARSLEGLPESHLDALQQALRATLHAALAANGNRAFGICRDCRHFTARGVGAYCGLMQLALEPNETAQICHEQAPARDADASGA